MTRKNLLFGLIVFGLAFLFSCNNNSGKKNEVKTDSTAVRSQSFKSFNGNFPWLSLSKDMLDHYFNPPPDSNLHKLVFRFRFENANAEPTLVIYGAKNMSVFQPPATPLGTMDPITLIPSVNISGEIFLGNLELTEAAYKILRQKAGSNPDLIFYPKISSNYPKQVTYQLNWGTAPKDSSAALLAPASSSDELNPSPPAPPGS